MFGQLSCSYPNLVYLLGDSIRQMLSILKAYKLKSVIIDEIVFKRVSFVLDVHLDAFTPSLGVVFASIFI